MEDNNEPINMNTAEASSDGYGGQGIAYEKFGEPEKAKEQDGVSISLVNGNGVASGRRMVDAIWCKIAIVMIMVAIASVTGVVYSFIQQKDLNQQIVTLTKDGQAAQSQLNGLMGMLGVNTPAEAIAAVEGIDLLSGDDMQGLAQLLGISTEIDFSKNSSNFIQKNGQYTVASFMIKNGGKGVRTVFYKDTADGEWKKAAFDATKKNHCEKSSEEELSAIRDILVCNADEEEK